MRRFLFTVPHKFKGAIEAHYNTGGQLIKIDFTGVQLTPEAVKFFKSAIPVMVDNIESNFDGKGVTVEETEFIVTYDDFYREYPYKRNSHLAQAHWPKLTSNQQYLAFIQAIEYRNYCSRNTWYKPQIADKWLKTEQFKNNWKEL